MRVLGGDIDPNAIFVTSQNLEKVGPADLARWDATALPLETASVDRIVSNPPFGKQLSSIDLIGPLYEAASMEWDRVLRPGGRAVLLAMEQEGLRRTLAPPLVVAAGIQGPPARSTGGPQRLAEAIGSVIDVKSMNHHRASWTSV